MKKELDEKFDIQDKMIEKRYEIDVTLFVEELAKLWKVPIENLQVQATTNVFSNLYNGMPDTQVVRYLHSAANSGTGRLILNVSVKDYTVGENPRSVKLTNILSLNSIQKDGKTTKEHLVLVNDAQNGTGFRYDDYKKMVMGYSFVNEVLMDQNGNIRFDNIRDQACYNAVMLKELENEREAD